MAARFIAVILACLASWSSAFLVSPLFASSRSPARQLKTPPARNFPGMAGFPPHEAFPALGQRLDGDLVSAFSPEYANVSLTWNLRVAAFPLAHVMAASVGDVQQAISFAKKYNLMLAVRSSGHSFIGRSTYDGGFVINMSKMKKISFNLDSVRSKAGEVTVQTGASWLEVYEAVERQMTYDAVGNPQRRLVVGGSAHTVAMGGYTQGGGHSPYSRMLGLAVDNLLEFEIVLADGRVAVVNAAGTTLTSLEGGVTSSNDTSLWWAVRGGGGGTWGVVTSFTFRLHYAPQRFRQVSQSWALTYKGVDIGSAELEHILIQMAQLSPAWGGYVLLHGAPLSPDAKGAVSVSLLHFGSDDDASNSEVDALLAYNPHQSTFGANETSFDTFFQYESLPKDGAHSNSYVFSAFIQPDITTNATRRADLVAMMMDVVNAPTNDSMHGCTGTLIGGNTKNIPPGETPVNPAFRSGMLAMTCGVAWPANTGRDHVYIAEALERRDILLRAGEGSYFNEPAEDLPDWKTRFWGDMATYSRLLAVKRQWDPTGLFWCHNCVGSDLTVGVNNP